MNPQNGLVRGAPAYVWSLALVLSAALTALGAASIIGGFLQVATSGRADLAPVGLPLAITVLGLVGLPLSRRALPVVAAREASAGYTTVPFFSGELPLHDWRDGRELIAAGAEMPRVYRLSLRPARRLSDARSAPAAAALATDIAAGAAVSEPVAA